MSKFRFGENAESAVFGFNFISNCLKKKHISQYYKKIQDLTFNLKLLLKSSLLLKLLYFIHDKMRYLIIKGSSRMFLVSKHSPCIPK